jgi:hypothetical protein
MGCVLLSKDVCRRLAERAHNLSMVNCFTISLPVIGSAPVRRLAAIWSRVQLWAAIE